MKSHQSKTLQSSPVLITISSLVATTIISGLYLSSSIVSADNDSVVDEINVTVPVSCTLSGTGMNSHDANINNGQYNSAIGETTLKAYCNDNEGFAIYAVGFTDNKPGKNVLTNSILGDTYDITTGTAISGTDSKWAMKLSTITNPAPTYLITIAGSSADTEKESGDPDFTSFQEVPNTYTKVAYRTSNTDVGTNAEGSTLTTTYQAYISPTQAAGTYTGQVKYTMVHPYNATAPVTHPAVLDTGKTINTKLRSLAATVVNGEETTIIPEFDPEGDNDYYYAHDEYIKSINVHLETPAPADFIPSEKNTISSSASGKPVYIVFDNTNDAGVMHFYTEGEQIVLPSDSSFMFYYLYNLGDLSALSNWDASNVTNMEYMFFYTGYNVTTFSLGDLSGWDTANVTNMSALFYLAGRSATTWSVGDLSSWNTANVTDMSGTFYFAGHSATTFSLGDISNWNTSNVTNMEYMFFYAGYNATTWFIGNLSGWNTVNVTNMDHLFSHAGCQAATFSLDLSGWNTTNATNMDRMFGGAGYSATTFSLNLSGWDTLNITNMERMFEGAGYNATTFSLNLSGWNTSNVTNMTFMLSDVGHSATTWSVTIPSTNGGGIGNTTSQLFGQTTSIYVAPPIGRSFTLAQP